MMLRPIFQVDLKDLHSTMATYHDHRQYIAVSLIIQGVVENVGLKTALVPINGCMITSGKY